MICWLVSEIGWEINMADTTTRTKNWHRVKIKNLGRVITGKTPPTKNQEYYGDKYPFITPTDISDSSIHVIPERYLSKEGAQKIASSKLPKNSVCYTCIASVGKIAITQEESFTNQQINSIIADQDEADYRYVFYLLRNMTPQIKGMVGGAASPIINKSAFEDIDIDIPNLPTQKQIADVLSAYDDLIENNTRRIKILEEIAQAIYREWFSEEKGEVTKLENCFSIQRGKSYRSDELSDDAGVPFVNLKCIDRDGGFRKSGLKRFVGIFKESQKVVAGDIVVAVTDMTQDRRIVAHAARIPTLEGGFGAISMDLVKLQPKEDCDPDYLYCVLRWSGFSDEVKNHANGANVLHLNPARIIDYKTIIALPEKQKEFGRKVHPIFDLVDRLKLQNESLRPARDLLLPKLVTGKIEVKK